MFGVLGRMNILSEQSVASLSWQSAHSENTQAGVSIWPIFTFFGLMFGAPYIISKMLPCEETSATRKYFILFWSFQQSKPIIKYIYSFCFNLDD